MSRGSKMMDERLELAQRPKTASNFRPFIFARSYPRYNVVPSK